MFISDLFEKYADLKVLRFFLDNPETPIHVKELARKLNVSPATASSVCKAAEKDGLLVLQKVANVHVYRLNTKSKQAKALQEVTRLL